jgi:hypothetical protein
MMTLAAILVVSLSLGCSPRCILGFAAQPGDKQSPAVTTARSSTAASQNSAPPSQQASPAQSPDSTVPLPAPPADQTQTPAGPAKPSPSKPHRPHKKATTANCSTAPTALNPAVGSTADSKNAGSTNTGSNDAGATSTDSSNAAAAPAKPCPPPKKVVRNGGSPEPTVQLKGGTAEEASHQRSTTDQLATATQENLKKIAERQLTPSQQEIVSQIKQFMEQSKAAVAAGDLERGRNLAMKAHLLSDELVKP